MTIEELLEMLDGSGIIITDIDEVADMLHELGCSLYTEIEIDED